MNNKKTLLIADDSALNRIFLEKIFCEEYNILTAENGVQALAYLRTENQISVAILDIIMPEMSGFEVMQEMNKDQRLKRIPVVIITGSDDEKTQIQALDYGASDIVIKPFNTQIILHRIRNLINRLESDKLADKGQEYRQRLRQAERDTKTGMYNKFAFYNYTAEFLYQHPEKEYVILRWDIDHFKVFNDRYGMEEGDRLLKKIGRYYHEFVSRNTAVKLYAHFDADQFVTIREKDSFDIDEICATIDQKIASCYPDFEFVSRIGIYEITDRSLDVALMCDRALLALRSIKNSFTKRYAWFDVSMRQRLLEEQEISRDMRTALNQEQFEVYFQPQYNYATGMLNGAEALVRWNHPKKGLLLPGSFVSIFEKNGFVSRMDQYVWRKACQHLRSWLDADLPVVPVSVNVSRNDIYNPRLCDIFTDLISEYKLSPSLLRLEITESFYMDAPQQIAKMVRQLQSNGFAVEIDDFGTGYSSLNTLKDLPADALKLDMKFISESLKNTRGDNILNFIVQMARSIDLPVIAEGVESKQQADYLKNIGCEHMQGYYFSKPVAKINFEEILKKHGQI